MPQLNPILKGKSFTSDVLIAADDGGKLPEKIMVLPIGEFNTMGYGTMQITREHCDQFVANFKAGVRKLVPIDFDHDGGKAGGWIKEVIASDEGLFARVKWNKLGKEALIEEIYALFSAEWSFDYVDPEHGTRHGAVLIAGTLTNRPLFKELPVLVANEQMGLTNGKNITILFSSEGQNMKISKILAKKPADRTVEEVAFLKENAGDFTEDQKKQQEAEVAEAEKAQADADAAAQKEKEEAEAAAAAKKEQEEKEAAERKAMEGKTVTITASEHAEFLKAKEDARIAGEKLRRVEVEKEMRKYMASETGGKLPPKFYKDDSLVNFVLTCSEEQKKQFITFVEALPELKIAGEKGDSDTSVLTAKQQFDKLVSDKMTANDKLSKHDAMSLVRQENPKLMAEYEAEKK